MLLSALPALVYVGLVVYSVIDCLQTPAEELHRLTRSSWILAIVLIPLIGAVGWLLAGRISHGRRHERAPSGPDRADGYGYGYGWTVEGMAQGPIGPDDDPEFMAGLGRAQREQKRLLTRQEEDRRRRARERRGEPDDPEASGPDQA